MAGDESSEQTNEWKPQGLADVLEVLGCFEENQLDANEMPMELIMDLDSIEIENTLDDSFDGFVQTREGGKASLEMSDGSLLICSLSVVRRSAYLSDMSKVKYISLKFSDAKFWLLIKLHPSDLNSQSVKGYSQAFDSIESLPIPSIVGNEEMKRLIVLTELLESQDEREHEDLVRHHLVDIDLPALLRLLKAADFLSCSLTSLVEGEVIKLVNIENWTKVFLSCHSVMGLKTLQEFLLDFLLHQESDSDGEKVKLGEDTPVRFIKSVLEQTKFPICEEAKLDLVLDWAAKSESATEEEKIDVLGKVKLKCFDEVDTLEQLKIDIHQVDFIDEECRENYLLDINEAIEFKKQPWDLSFDYVRGREKLLDMRELLREKSNLPWPKLVGLFPRNSSNSKYRLLNNSSLQLQGKLGRLADLSDRVDTESLLCYRTSLFFISTSEDKLPSLCQQNFDLNLTFHVLDLPSALRSINDEYHCRSGQFAICQVRSYPYLFFTQHFLKKLPGGELSISDCRRHFQSNGLRQPGQERYVPSQLGLGHRVLQPSAGNRECQHLAVGARHRHPGGVPHLQPQPAVQRGFHQDGRSARQRPHPHRRHLCRVQCWENRMEGGGAGTSSSKQSNCDRFSRQPLHHRWILHGKTPCIRLEDELLSS